MQRSFFLRNKWFFGLLLFALVVVVRLPSLEQPLDNDSGAMAYDARMILHGEPLYGTHHPAHHLPATFYTYALIFGLLGDSAVSLKIFLIPWMWLNAWILYRVGSTVKNQEAGMLAAVFFVLTSSMTNTLGDTAEIELFANLPLTLIIWLGIVFLERKSRPIVYSLIGIVGAVGFLYKAVYLTSLAAVAVMMLLNAILEQHRAAWLEFFKRSTAILAGFVTVLGFVAAYFAVLGLWPRLWLVFQLGSEYATQNNDFSAIFIFLLPFLTVGFANAALVLIGFVSVTRTLISLPRVISSDRQKGLILVMGLAWLFTSVIAAGISRYGFLHYGLLILPPLALFVGVEIVELRDRVNESEHRNQLAWLPILLVFVVIGNTIYTSKDYLGGYLRYRLGYTTLAEFVGEDTGQGHQRMNIVEVAQYIARHTSPEDTIFAWTSQTQLYYLAGRRSSSNILWPEYVAVLGPPERVFESKPRYIIVGPNPMSASQMPEWLASELTRSYAIETTIGDQRIYRRIQP